MDISLEENRNALIRISQFVLEEEAEKARNGLEEKIVEAALFWGIKEEEYAPISKIAELVETEIRLVSFPGETLKNILSRLLGKGSIVEDEDGSYKLSVVKRKEFEILVNEKKGGIDRINSQFLLSLEREYGKKLTDEQKKEGLEKLYSLLTSLALEKSDLIARIVTQKNVENLPLELSIHKLYGILGKIGEVDLRNAEFRAIKLIFREGSNDFCGFLFSLTQNLICIQILNLDPECQALERKAFADKVLFLDTNILVGLVCPTHWQHKSAMYLIKLSKSLGVRLTVAKITCDEFNAALEEANRVFKKWEGPTRLLENADNDFLTSFWSESQTNQSLSWSSYYERTKDIGKMLNEQGIELYVESMDKIRSDARYRAAVTQVNQCYYIYKGRSKNVHVCEHDASLLLLIRELRSGQTLALLGPNYWFITGDDTLMCVDRWINSISGPTASTPSSMLFDVWLDMVTPFLPLSVRKEDASEAFATFVRLQFARVPFQIDVEKLVKIQGSWTKYEWLEPEDIIRIQNKEWTRQYLKRLEKIKTQEDQAKAEEMGKIFAQKLEEELRIISDEKLKKLMDDKKVLTEKETLLSTAIEEKIKEIEKGQEIIETQKGDIELKQSVIQSKNRELENEAHFKRQIRVVTVIAGLFLVVSPLAMMVLKALPIMFESVVYFAVSLIVGAILLYFGIAPERADVSVRANVDVSESRKD